MFVGRKKEQKRINDWLRQKTAGAFVLYGREAMGKTTLALRAVQQQAYVYYRVKECSLHTQLQCMSAEFFLTLSQTGERQRLKETFEELLKQQGAGPVILLLDEFHVMADHDGIFFEVLEELAQKYPVRFLLISSSVSWVENDMLRCLGNTQNVIAQTMKLNELDFADAYDFFPEYSTERMIAVYSILGGVPGLLQLWDPKKEIRQNVIDQILSPEGSMHGFAQHLLKRELRELSSYHTILLSLARNADAAKLNDLFEQTGYSRAKLSVYMKNLSEMDLLEKVFSYGEYGKEHTVKGLYRIKDAYLRFYYTFVFPNLTLLELQGAEALYDQRLKKELTAFCCSGFYRVCKEYLLFMNELRRLPFTFEKCGAWYGKDGRIDLIADNPEEQQLVAFCKWDEEAYDEEDLEQAITLIGQAGTDPEHYYIFSKSGFVSSVERKTEAMENFHLIALDQL